MLGVSIGLVKKLINASFGSISVDGGQIASNAVTASHIASNAVGASEIASNAVGTSEINTTFTTNVTKTISQNGSWTIPAGIYVIQVGNLSLEIYVSGAWRRCTQGADGAVISDGSNMRMKNYSIATTCYYRQMA